jgi:hypothetical protein
VAADDNNNNVTGSQDNNWSKPQHSWNSGAIHPFTGALSGLKIHDTNHANKDSSPITFFSLFFIDMIPLSVAEINKYYNQYLGTLDNGDGC